MVQPIKEGVGVKIWKTPLRQIPEQTQIGGWLVEQLGVHAFWSRWLIALVHLRPVERLAEPPKLHFPTATHELVAAALDPESYGDHDKILAGEIEDDWKWLQPLDQVHQFQVTSDDMALVVVDKHLDAIAAGQLSPDSDFRSFWERSLRATAEHYVKGVHPIA